MDFESFATLYRTKTADELLYLAAQGDELTPEAYAALSVELASRRIEFVANGDIPAASNSNARSNTPSAHIKTGEFIEKVLRFYNQNRWTFIKLMFPAVLVGTIAVIWGRNESHEISRRVYRQGGILRHPIGMVEIGLATWGSYLVSWITFCFSFVQFARQLSRYKLVSTHRLPIRLLLFANDKGHFCDSPSYSGSFL